jgi:predicted DCC family thiol-disulfide oxidoreductase YuxK
MSDENTIIIIFDTDCVLCSRWIRFILQHERTDDIQFASSRKSNGKKLAKEFGISPNALDLTYVVIDGERAHTKSNASLVILGKLNRPWSWLRILGLVPRTLRDRIYDIVARNRLQWFGEEKDCFLPSVEQRHRFLD